MQAIRTLAIAAALLAGAASAQAALVNRGGGMIYDTTQNLTWLADMNYARTGGYYNSGLMTWAAADEWANNLVYGGFSDWRLPTLNSGDTSCSHIFSPGDGFPRQYHGSNCTGGEMSHLFVADLGNKANESVLNPNGDTPEQIANLALFGNVQYGYWSGLEYAPKTVWAWVFYTYTGRQANGVKDDKLFAVAVRPGDVAASVPEPQRPGDVAASVPEPQTLALVLLAFGATVVARKRRPA